MADSAHAELDPEHADMSSQVPQKEPDAVPCSIPSFAVASELLPAPYSCLVLDTHRRHVALPPAYLQRKRTGIRGELEAELLRFSPSLNGVPLAYDDIRIVRQHGDIIDDSSYIHMDVEASFIVFQPQKGQKLLGKVNKLGVSHVGCLVHGCFNASIPKPNLVSMETWMGAGPRIGADLEFEVTALDADAVGVLLIRGRLDRTRVQELMAMGESSETSVPADEPDAADAEPTPEATEDTPKKKKKKKKDKVKEEEAEEEVSLAVSELNGTTGEANANEGAETKKRKKKKKEKRLKEEEEQLELSPMCVNGSDSSGYVSDKPGKKRKHDGGGEVTPEISEEPEPPKSKKKRKHNIEQLRI